MRKWIGVDFDGTLAQGHDFGAPVPAMMARVQAWLCEGIEVRIVTARALFPDQRIAVCQWLGRHGLPLLLITDRKDIDMLELWDDRAVQVERDTGKRMDGQDG